MNIRSDRLSQVIEIAEKAGIIAKRFFCSHELKKSFKSKCDLVSEADLTIEKMLIESLKTVDDIEFLSEEFNPGTSLAAPCWIVDPIDGTTNFVAGIAPFAISIARYDGCGVDLAVCFLPVTNEMFSAEKGRGAFLNGERISVNRDDDPINCVGATGFADITQHGGTGTLPVFCSMVQKTRAMRRLGSAVTDLVYTACGKFAFFYEAGLSPWDVAAGSLIVKEAGGIVTDFSGGNDYILGKTIIASNPAMHDFVKTEIADSLQRTKI
ncbi:inositol monophosphatase [bacterium]|nr:inositol monophosphatase [bacterium]